MTTLIENKTMSFGKVVTDLKRFIPRKNSPQLERHAVLKCIYFDGQYLYATDSFKAIRVNAKYIELPMDDPFLYDVYEKKFYRTIEGKSTSNDYKYLNMNRLFPDTFNTEFRLTNRQVTEYKKAIELMHTVAKHNRNNVMQLDVKQYELTFSVENEDDEITGKQIMDNITIVGDELTVHFNSEFMNKAFMSVKKLIKLNDKKDQVEVKFTGKLRPITITDNEVFETIILPVRVN